MNYLERSRETSQSETSDLTEATWLSSPNGLKSGDRGHIFIAGTGRSGTSFLVRYLTELGLETNLSRNGEQAFWDEAANAGLEDLAIPSSFEDLPYVVKSPWLYQHVGELIESNAVRIDVVIIPVRNLVDAATSRSIVELRAVHQAAPWMTQFKKTWEHWGHTPGGLLFSLSPLDQARLLAVGFHTLIENLIRADIPILFLDFPRLVQDGSYLFSKLRPWLPSSIQEQQGLAAHQRVADPKKIRVGGETSAQNKKETTISAFQLATVAYDDQTVLDQLAIRRELERLRGVEAEQPAIKSELQRLRTIEGNLAHTIRAQECELERLREIEVRLDMTRATLANIYASRSWKMVLPLRRFAATIRSFVRVISKWIRSI